VDRFLKRVGFRVMAMYRINECCKSGRKSMGKNHVDLKNPLKTSVLNPLHPQGP
jgi:hypothetical protein